MNDQRTHVIGGDLKAGDHVRIVGWGVWVKVVRTSGRDVLVSAPNKVFALVPRVAISEVVRP